MKLNIYLCVRRHSACRQIKSNLGKSHFWAVSARQDGSTNLAVINMDSLEGPTYKTVLV
jgi:hypothetical protein